MARGPAAPTSKTAETAALVTTLSQQGATADPNVALLAGILAKKLLREERQLEQLAEEKKTQRKQGAQAMETRRQSLANAQAQCPHMKPWGGSALAGQRTHQHNTLLLCQFCGKVWDGTDVPAHLRIPAERIGGPDN